MTPEVSQNCLEFIPEIDLQSALNRMMGSRQLLTDLLKEFSEKYTGFSSRVKKALLINDFETAKSMVHTFKGSTGTLSLENLFCAAEILEKSLEQNNYFFTERELTKIDEILNPLILAINSLRSEETEELLPSEQQPTTNAGKKELTRLLASLSDSLVCHNLKAVNQLEESKKLFQGTKNYGAIREMEIYVKKLDFIAAKSCLDALAADLGIDLH
jgi:HPt (histidine-containing phosphotransfer) domain-containing protein